MCVFVCVCAHACVCVRMHVCVCVLLLSYTSILAGVTSIKHYLELCYEKYSCDVSDLLTITKYRLQPGLGEWVQD